MTKPIAVFGLLLVSIYIGYSVSATVSATEEANVTSEKKQLPDSAQVVGQGQLPESSSSARTAYIDPKTGELTSQSSSPISNNQTQEAELKPVKYTRYPNGTVGATLEGRFHSQLTATIDCDGKVKTEHAEELASDTGKCEAP